MGHFHDKTMQAAFRYAKSQTAFYSKSFYFSSQILPADKKWDTFALYSFCRYADNIVDNPRNRADAELFEEVASVSRELQIAYRRGESEHPVIKPFIEVAKRRSIPFEYPNDLLDGVKMDLLQNRYETFADLYEFAYRVAGVVGLMMTHVLGFSDKEALIYAEKLGIAMQLTNILRDIQEDKNMNRIYLPLSEFKEFGITEDDIKNERFTYNMYRFMEFQVERAHRYFEEAQPGIKMLDQDSRFAITSASRIYRGILRQIERNGYNPYLGRAFVSQGKKFAILFNEVMKTRVLQPVTAMLASFIG
ncbi:phytoene/squalene synthase family protein [candidate division KSB1 bacterium]|nr:phytoene/squalene synthase family protein [candidate division KSB1 bacterium]RQW01679.1 MAG: phytoene/squalene synthase family protein [candidate division KSB1 bacterium]